MSVHRVSGERFRFRSCRREHGDVTLLATEVELPVNQDRGRPVVTAETFLPDFFTSLGVKATSDPVVGHQKQEAINKARRRDVR